MAEILLPNVTAFELNISCPHAKGQSQVVGSDYLLVEKIIKEVKTLGKPVFVKLSPKLDIEKSLDAILKGGADGVCAINTWGPETFEFGGYPVLSNKVGGLSGRQILDKGIKVIETIRKLAPNLPIIASGGISHADNLRRYQQAAKNTNIYYSVGSALTGMDTQKLVSYFKKLNEDLENGTNYSQFLLKENLNMDYQKIVVRKKQQLASDLFTLTFNNSIEALPGQFVMLWNAKNGGEKPFSVYHDQPFEILFQKKEVVLLIN